MKSKAGKLKMDLRRKMSARRDAMDAVGKAAYDKRMTDRLAQIIAEADYRTVHCYIPIRSEIDILPFVRWLLDSGISVVTARTEGNGVLKHVLVESLDDLVTGRFGTRSPRDGAAFSGVLDAVIVPGLAVDRRRYRLGYGGGYYDRFLAGHPEAVTIGVFYPFQEVAALPVEDHDVPLDKILIDRSDIDVECGTDN